MSLPGKIQDRVVISNLPRNYEPANREPTAFTTDQLALESEVCASCVLYQLVYKVFKQRDVEVSSRLPSI